MVWYGVPLTNNSQNWAAISCLLGFKCTGSPGVPSYLGPASFVWMKRGGRLSLATWLCYIWKINLFPTCCNKNCYHSHFEHRGMQINVGQVYVKSKSHVSNKRGILLWGKLQTVSPSDKIGSSMDWSSLERRMRWLGTSVRWCRGKTDDLDCYAILAGHIGWFLWNWKVNVIKTFLYLRK